MAKYCIYKCGTLLEGFDEEAHKYKEAQTGGIHTKERCQEAKAKLEAKNDHGNELVQDTTKPESPKQMYERYVDHTQQAKGQSKVKVFYAPGTDVLEEKYNNFLKINNGQIRTQGAQFQIGTDGFAIALYYEEVKT